MSDFLSNLVARGLNLTDNIQPRVASKFVPMLSPEGMSSGHQVAPDMLDSKSQSTEPESDEISSRPPRTAYQPGSDRSVLEERLDRGSGDKHHYEEMAGSLPRALALRQESEIALHVRPRITERDVDLRKAELNPTNSVPQTKKIPAVHMEQLSVAGRPIVEVGSISTNALRPSLQLKTGEPGASLTPAATNRSSPDKFLEPLITKDVKSIISEPSKPTGKVEPPTIQVHIGRIEVRAVPSPAASVQQRRSSGLPPILSLEDYLKQRNREHG